MQQVSKRWRLKTERTPYLVGLVVVLWIVLKDFRFLRVVEVADEVIQTKLFAPFLAISEPEPAISRDSSTLPRQLTCPVQPSHRTFVLARIAAVTGSEGAHWTTRRVPNQSQGIESLSVTSGLELRS